MRVHGNSKDRVDPLRVQRVHAEKRSAGYVIKWNGQTGRRRLPIQSIVVRTENAFQFCAAVEHGWRARCCGHSDNGAGKTNIRALPGLSSVEAAAESRF